MAAAVKDLESLSSNQLPSNMPASDPAKCPTEGSESLKGCRSEPDPDHPVIGATCIEQLPNGDK